MPRFRPGWTLGKCESKIQKNCRCRLWMDGGRLIFHLYWCNYQTRTYNFMRTKSWNLEQCLFFILALKSWSYIKVKKSLCQNFSQHPVIKQYNIQRHFYRPSLLFVRIMNLHCAMYINSLPNTRNTRYITLNEWIIFIRPVMDKKIDMNIVY